MTIPERIEAALEDYAAGQSRLTERQAELLEELGRQSKLSQAQVDLVLQLLQEGGHE